MIMPASHGRVVADTTRSLTQYILSEIVLVMIYGAAEPDRVVRSAGEAGGGRRKSLAMSAEKGELRESEEGKGKFIRWRRRRLMHRRRGEREEIKRLIYGLSRR